MRDNVIAFSVWLGILVLMSEAECSTHAEVVLAQLDSVVGSPGSADTQKERPGPDGMKADDREGLGVLNPPFGHDHSQPIDRTQIAQTAVSLATAHLRSQHSKRAYRQAVVEFLSWCAATGTSTLTKSTVYEYIAELNRLRMSPATINVALCAIRRLVSELADNGLMNADNATRILRIKGPHRKGVRLGNWLSVEDAERLVRAPDATTNRGKRDRALIAVLLGAGLRRSEASQLSLAQLQKREDRWVIVDLVGKHDRVRSVPIPGWTKEAIDEWIAVANIRGGLIFRRIDKAGKVQDGAISSNAVYQIVQQYAVDVGAAIAPHDVRRTFAKLAHLGKAGLDWQIQLALGHSSILTTEQYLGIRQNLHDAPCDHLGLSINSRLWTV